jgi:hypothetical protein
VQVDHRHLAVLGADLAVLRKSDVAPDQAPQRPLGGPQPTDEGVDGAQSRSGARPLRAGVLVQEAIANDVDQVRVGPSGRPTHTHRARGIRAVRGLDAELRRHLVNHDRVLVAVVLGVREDVRQQLLLAELGERPPERVDAAGAARHVGASGEVAENGRGEEAHRGEGPGRQAELVVPGEEVVVEVDVLLVEEQ